MVAQGFRREPSRAMAGGRISSGRTSGDRHDRSSDGGATGPGPRQFRCSATSHGRNPCYSGSSRRRVQCSGWLAEQRHGLAGRLSPAVTMEQAPGRRPISWPVRLVPPASFRLRLVETQRRYSLTGGPPGRPFYPTRPADSISIVLVERVPVVLIGLSRLCPWRQRRRYSLTGGPPTTWLHPASLVALRPPQKKFRRFLCHPE